MLRIQARHIQVADQATAEQAIAQLQSGRSFADVAGEYSQCPTSRQGGHLGEFGIGHMPSEMDTTLLQGVLGTVYGPIQTPHGLHLLEVISRSE